MLVISAFLLEISQIKGAIDILLLLRMSAHVYALEKTSLKQPRRLHQGRRKVKNEFICY